MPNSDRHARVEGGTRVVPVPRVGGGTDGRLSGPHFIIQRPLINCLVDNQTDTKGNFEFRRKLEGDPTLIGDPKMDDSAGKITEAPRTRSRSRTPTPTPEREARVEDLCRERGRATESWDLTAV